MKEKHVVLGFYEAMRTNNFYAASECFSEDFECHWPQSGELISGRLNFAQLNTQYPAHGPWTFEITNIISEGNQVVTDVFVSDGVQKGRAITFHTVANGLITRQVEFWPDPFEAPAWRSQWVKIQV